MKKREVLIGEKHIAMYMWQRAITRKLVCVYCRKVS